MRIRGRESSSFQIAAFVCLPSTENALSLLSSEYFLLHFLHLCVDSNPHPICWQRFLYSSWHAQSIWLFRYIKPLTVDRGLNSLSRNGNFIQSTLKKGKEQGQLTPSWSYLKKYLRIRFDIFHLILNEIAAAAFFDEMNAKMHMDLSRWSHHTKAASSDAGSRSATSQLHA